MKYVTDLKLNDTIFLLDDNDKIHSWKIYGIERHPDTLFGLPDQIKYNVKCYDSMNRLKQFTCKDIQLADERIESLFYFKMSLSLIGLQIK